MLSKSKNTYLGILAGVFAFKIMPPDIVIFAAALILMPHAFITLCARRRLYSFLYAVYKLYKSQSDNEDRLRALPIASLFLVIPFAASVAETLSKYAYIKTGNDGALCAGRRIFYCRGICAYDNLQHLRRQKRLAYLRFCNHFICR